MFGRLTPKACEFTKLFWRQDMRVQCPSSYWLMMYFLDLHLTLLKSNRQLFAAFQKSFEKIREMCQLSEKGTNIKKQIVNALPVFKRVF